MKRIFLGVAMLCLFGCTSQTELREFQQGMVKKTQTRYAALFNAIHIEGSFDVELHTGYRHARVVFKGARDGLPLIETFIQNHTLWIRCVERCAQYGHFKVRIETKQLNAFYYDGTGRITGQALHAPRLNLMIRNSEQTTLGGELGLHQVTLAGGGMTSLSGVRTRDLRLKIKDHSKLQLAGWVRVGSLQLGEGTWVSLYWLEAKRLTLREHGNTVIQMAGVVDMLDVELWGTSRFKGRYLRARESFVKTHDHSIAEVTTLEHQHSLSTDASDIYYYKVPETKADYMAFNGSVLDMHEWTQDGRFDPYNKFNK